MPGFFKRVPPRYDCADAVGLNDVLGEATVVPTEVDPKATVQIEPIESNQKPLTIEQGPCIDLGNYFPEDKDTEEVE